MQPDVTPSASAALALAATLGLAAIACTQPSTGSPTSAPSVSAAAPAASAAGPTPRPTPSSLTWTGTYTSTPGSLYVYDGGEWKGVHFRGDDASVALGEGPLALTVDTTTKRLSGSASGPIGNVFFTGLADGDALTFSVLRRDPTDHGLSGTGSGTVKGTIAKGTMRLSRGDAHVLREVTWSATAGTP